MLRCVLAAALAAAALPVAAQVQRMFPADALRGELVVVQPPQVRLNGKDARLAAGARIRNERNMLALSGSLLGQPLVVNYTIDGFGAVKDVWVLTPSERAKPWPSTTKEAQSWTFDPATHSWAKP
jgi:hypothetical protein